MLNTMEEGRVDEGEDYERIRMLTIVVVDACGAESYGEDRQPHYGRCGLGWTVLVLCAIWHFLTTSEHSCFRRIYSQC